MSIKKNKTGPITEESTQEDPSAGVAGEPDGQTLAPDVAAAAVEATPEADAGEPKQKTIKRTLVCKLSAEELSSMGVEMGETEVAIEKKKAAVSELNEAKRKLEGHRNALGHALEAGEEEREILCYVNEDFVSNTVRVVRSDTGETIEERTMSAAERQIGLGFDKSAQTTGTGADEEDDDPAPDEKMRTMSDEQASDDDDDEGPEDDDDDDFVDDDDDDDLVTPPA
jgi:hypothetical protein